MRFSRFALWVAAVTAATAVLLSTRRATAYPDYASGCDICHGTFNSGTYVSLKDGQSWGTDLMNGHLDNIIGGSGGQRCNVCHSGSGKSLVPLNTSNGTGSLPVLGCMGCHGRAADNISSNPDWGKKTGYGAGLRQHHWANGVKICNNCHKDADPAQYTPVGEDVLPPYYGDTTFPLIPTDPCNPGSSEDRIASTLGLDNDGDDAFDLSDSDCSCTATTCAAEGKDCGSISDGCGGTLGCGSCTAPQTCGGGGTANVCGCTPTSCAAEDKNCGSISDGCGGSLDCSTCASPDTCSGGGTPNVCGCAPDTCASLGVQCGAVGDGCGGLLDCGGCTPPASCAAGVCVDADAGTGADSGVPDAAEASTDAFVDAQQDAPAEATGDATTGDAATGDAATGDAATGDATTGDALAEATAGDATGHDALAEAATDAGAAANDAGASSASSGDNGGCSCHLAGGGRSPASGMWLLALSALLLSQVRRRRRNRRT